MSYSIELCHVLFNAQNATFHWKMFPRQFWGWFVLFKRGWDGGRRGQRNLSYFFYKEKKDLIVFETCYNLIPRGWTCKTWREKHHRCSVLFLGLAVIPNSCSCHDYFHDPICIKKSLLQCLLFSPFWLIIWLLFSLYISGFMVKSFFNQWSCFCYITVQTSLEEHLRISC